MDFEELLDLATLDNIAAALDLRAPNREAVETIAIELGRHYDLDARTDTFEGVVDSATGVGKTYIFAAALEYLAQVRGVRDFVLVAPSRVILNKTIDQFTAGHAKSIVDSLPAPITLVTAENFDTPTISAAMDDADQVKLYVFSVQALLKPSTKQGRRTHEFQEGLGAGFYERLKQAPLLTVFADEHHAYYGAEFSKAVRELEAWALIGLTATPSSKTPEEQIIFRYPLAAAIADRFVKTPVIVGRRDDKIGAVTKLLDGAGLLEHKREIADDYADKNGLARVNPIMLVVAKDIAEANEWADIVRSDDFKGGAYRDAVLVVHSRQPMAEEKEAAELRRLEDVEHPDSPTKVVISVAMLKEGWDVKNVYVLVSTRPMLSQLLTEQVLGRGLRLPFGVYTDVQFLDTLEVLAHERFEELLKKTNILNESFIDYRTRAVVRYDAQGNPQVRRERVEVANPVREVAGVTPLAGGTPILVDLPRRAEQGSSEATSMRTTIVPKTTINVPRLRPTKVASSFSLTDITERDTFTALGRSIAADPAGTLRRVMVGARVVQDASGIKQVQMVTEDAADRMEASDTAMSIDSAKTMLVDALLAMPVVSARDDAQGTERRAAEAIVEMFINGFGGTEHELLPAYLERSMSALLSVVNEEYRRFAPKVQYDEKVESIEFGQVRANSRPTTADRYGTFERQLSYEGWVRSLYPLNWFDSSTERSLANLVDDDDCIDYWVRLLLGDLPILWTADGHQYHADFVVRETSGDDWIVEVKADKDKTAEAVEGKRTAAKRWANKVNASGQFKNEWHYLLVTETDVKSAKGSWRSLRQLGT